MERRFEVKKEEIYIERVKKIQELVLKSEQLFGTDGYIDPKKILELPMLGLYGTTIHSVKHYINSGVIPSSQTTSIVGLNYVKNEYHKGNDDLTIITNALETATHYAESSAIFIDFLAKLGLLRISSKEHMSLLGGLSDENRDVIIDFLKNPSQQQDKQKLSEFIETVVQDSIGIIENQISLDILLNEEETKLLAYKRRVASSVSNYFNNPENFTASIDRSSRYNGIIVFLKEGSNLGEEVFTHRALTIERNFKTPSGINIDDAYCIVPLGVDEVDFVNNLSKGFRGNAWFIKIEFKNLINPANVENLAYQLTVYIRAIDSKNGLITATNVNRGDEIIINGYLDARYLNKKVRLILQNEYKEIILIDVEE